MRQILMAVTATVFAIAAFAGSPALAEQATPERAMSPDSAKVGSSPGPKSERAMSPEAGKPGASPNPKSERAMDPDKSAK